VIVQKHFVRLLEEYRSDDFFTKASLIGFLDTQRAILDQLIDTAVANQAALPFVFKILEQLIGSLLHSDFSSSMCACCAAFNARVCVPEC
jgi:hypothetical protein